MYLLLAFMNLDMADAETTMSAHADAAGIFTVTDTLWYIFIGKSIYADLTGYAFRENPYE